MEKRNFNRNSNRQDKQCASSRELELERELMRESTRSDDADTYRMPYEQSIRIYIKQDEVYKKMETFKRNKRGKGENK